LQYWLDPKSKQAVTSVQSVEELNLFKVPLCPMLVPPLLPKLIKELQEKWTCNVHTHGDNPVYCYSPMNSMATGYTDPYPDPQARFSLINNIPDSKTPEIIAWFASVGEHNAQKKDHLKFTPFGQLLYNEGFRYLSQFSPSMMSLKELAASMGT
ncbi:hypothetical protein PAXRUDRAFT_162007, partial [Paxillus rubicundulus Ve08.2h10]